MQINYSSLNINSFNKSSDKLALFISQHNLHFTCIQETHTIQHQELSHFSHQHNLLVYPKTDHSLTPLISHRQGTLITINTKHIHLTSQMITSHFVLPNYIQSFSFTLTNINCTLINCYLPCGKTSTQTSNRIKAIKTLTSYLHNLEYKNNYVIIAGDFNLVLNPIDRTGHYPSNTNDKILFQKILSNFDLIDSYRYLYPNSRTFSFSRSHRTSRLDRIYIFSSLISKITHSSNHNIPFSDHNKAPLLSLKIPSKTKFKSSHWKLNNFILASSSTLFYINSFIKNLSSLLNLIQQSLQWWDLIKLKIKQRLIFYSKLNYNKMVRKQITLQENLTKAKHFKQHEEISNITNQLEQIQHNKQLGAQIRSRLPPLSSIDNPSPLASVTENLIQSKSLLSIDSNTSCSSSIKQNVLNNFSYLSFFKNLWNQITTLPDPLIYLDKIFTSNSNDILQTLPSPL